MKCFLDFDPFDNDTFCMKTCEEHDVVYEGRLSEVLPEGCDDPSAVLDELFEKEPGIKSGDWVVG